MASKDAQPPAGDAEERLDLYASVVRRTLVRMVEDKIREYEQERRDIRVIFCLERDAMMVSHNEELAQHAESIPARHARHKASREAFRANNQAEKSRASPGRCSFWSVPRLFSDLWNDMKEARLRRQEASYFQTEVWEMDDEHKWDLEGLQERFADMLNATNQRYAKDLGWDELKRNRSGVELRPSPDCRSNSFYGWHE